MQRRHRVLALVSALVLLGIGPALGQARTITVVEGDTLEQLALRYRVDLQALIDLNGIRDPTLLQVGEALKLPGAPGTTTRPPAIKYARICRAAALSISGS